MNDNVVTAIRGANERNDMYFNFYGGENVNADSRYVFTKEDLMNQHTAMLLFYERTKLDDFSEKERNSRRGEGCIPLIPRSLPLNIFDERKLFNGNGIIGNINSNNLMEGIETEMEGSVKLSVGDMKNYLKLFEGLFTSWVEKEKNNFDSKNPSAFNIAFTDSVYYPKSQNCEKSACFLWLWVNFLVSVCPHYPGMIDGLKRNLNNVADVLRKNKKLLLWFVAYAFKGEDCLRTSLENISFVSNVDAFSSASYSSSSSSSYSRPPPSSFSSSSVPSKTLFTKCLSNLNIPEFGVVLFDFLINKLLCSIDFREDVEMRMGIYCFVEIIKNIYNNNTFDIYTTSSFDISSFSNNFIKQMEYGNPKSYNYLLEKFLSPPNRFIHESFFLKLKQPELNIFESILNYYLQHCNSNNNFERFIYDFYTLLIHSAISLPHYLVNENAFDSLMKLYEGNYVKTTTRTSLNTFIEGIKERCIEYKTSGRIITILQTFFYKTN
jgi:hypothetical protein